MAYGQVWQPVLATHESMLVSCVPISMTVRHSSFIPIAKQWIDDQVHQGQKALTILSHFPFIGHQTTPEQDLVNIGRTLYNKEMPPIEYALLNTKGKLSEQEIRTIHKWVQNSLQLLQSTPGPQKTATYPKKSS